MLHVLARAVTRYELSHPLAHRPHERVERGEPAVHALVGAGTDAPVGVQLLEVVVQYREQRWSSSPVAQELLRVEQRVERRPKLRVDTQRAFVGRNTLSQPSRLSVARAEVLIGLAQDGLDGDGARELARRSIEVAALLEDG